MICRGAYAFNRNSLRYMIRIYEAILHTHFKNCSLRSLAAGQVETRRKQTDRSNANLIQTFVFD